jgi:WD40 repeat protein
VIGYAENDSEVQMYDSETERVVRFRNEASAKSGSLDPLGKYFASTACDGQVSIFTIPSEDSESNIGELIKRVKATKVHMEPFGKNPFEVSWSPDGSQLLVSGEAVLYSMARDNWELNTVKNISHKKTISFVTWLTDAVLATASVDKVIKIWNFENKTLLHSINC